MPSKKLLRDLQAIVLAGSLITGTRSVAQAQAASKLAHPGPDGKLVYVGDAKGNTILDFSNCGYQGGGVKLPTVKAKITVTPEPGDGDATARIQKAIDELSRMPLDKEGFRGAVMLKRGTYRIEKNLTIAASGVVLRGEGQGEDGTVLVGTGKAERVLVQVKGAQGVVESPGTQQAIIDKHVPVGARQVTVTSAAGFKVGDTVLVRRVGNRAWIHYIKMDQIALRPSDPTSTKQWSPFDLDFDRVITGIEGNQIALDAPIPCAIEQDWGGGRIMKYKDGGRIEQVGVENLRGESEFDKSITAKQGNKTYYSDEKHALGLLSFANVKNAWARDLTAVHFYHGVVHAGSGAKWVTVQDSSALDPVSVITGGRRYPYYNTGAQLVLMQRCYAKGERHAFAFGSHVCGPNVFLACRSEEDYATSEPHHRWSVGGLYDTVQAQMAFQDRQFMGTGHGWAGANYVAWNCEGTLVCQQPSTAQNYAIGFIGKKEPGAFKRLDGYWESQGQHVAPASLYLKQLEDRLGREAVANALTK
ncbi:MAG: hypothetical protein JWR69_1170 [Pedosphaera sp.]|nr:hypothetical protein [Pedosphaera sp.]